MHYDKTLTYATVIMLFAMAAVFFYSILSYSNMNSIEPGWAQTPTYGEFIVHMDKMQFPHVVLFLIILGLCIPKRILPRKLLYVMSLILLLISFSLYLKDYRLALGVVLLIGTILQMLVLIFSIAGKKLEFLGPGYFLRVGSSLIHFGVVYFVLSVVYPPFVVLDPLTVFWISTAVIAIGMFFIFYLREKDSYWRKPLES